MKIVSNKSQRRCWLTGSFGGSGTVVITWLQIINPKAAFVLFVYVRITN